MNQINSVVIGTVGAGYASRLHGGGYRNVGGIPFRLKTICDTNTELTEGVKKDYGYEKIESDYDEMLRDQEINVIDIVTPPFLHIPMAIKAFKAGKHVICEKPLTGYFGNPGEENVGMNTPRSVMCGRVLEGMNELRNVWLESGKKNFFTQRILSTLSLS